MKLKESFRYMNYLESLMNGGLSLLYNDSLITRVKEIHQRKKVNADDEDEIIEDANPSELNFDANTVIAFVNAVLTEREELSKAISVAKQLTSVDIDLATSNNKKKQILIERLKTMAMIKSSEKVVKKTGYKFNTDGNQVPYYYDMKSVTTIDFDRNHVKSLIKKLSDECDRTSLEIDMALLNTDVNFEPKWSLTDTLEDICEGLYIGK